MSNKEALRWITLGVLVFELHRYTFSAQVRSEILERDQFVCQSLQCTSTDKLTIHHIIPESCGKILDCQEKSYRSGDRYVDQVSFLLKSIISNLDFKSQIKFKRALRKITQSDNNGITLCLACHKRIHRDSSQSGRLILKTNLNHIHRPHSLQITDINQFLQQIISLG